MTATSSHLAKVLLNSSDLTAKLSNASATSTTEMLENTSLADQAKRFIAGLNGNSLSVSGFADADVVAAVVTAMDLVESFGANSNLAYAPAGLSLGSPVMLQSGKRANFEMGTEVGGLANFSTSVTGDGPVGHGVSLHALTAETIDGSGSSYDRGLTSTAGGAVAHLHVTAFSGLTNNIVIVEDSANNSDWSTIGTFSTYTSVTSQRLSISGTIRRYVRCSWNVTGSGTTTFTVALAPL